jgi:hypothetical protein
MLAGTPVVELQLGLVAEVLEGRGRSRFTRVSGDASPRAVIVASSAALSCSTCVRMIATTWMRWSSSRHSCLQQARKSQIAQWSTGYGYVSGPLAIASRSRPRSRP